MPKAESPLTPERLLAEIQAGSLKEEIIRTYRTTEAELAGTLSLLYRTGEIAKKEFNDFFKGVSLKKDSTPRTVQSRAEQAPDVSGPEKERDRAAAPSRISLSGLFSLRSRATAPEQTEKPAEMETAEPVGVAPDAEAVSVTEEISLEEALGFKDSARASIAGSESRAEMSQSPDLASEGPGKPSHLDEKERQPLLETILSRLDAIDTHLARIEKKLGAS